MIRRYCAALLLLFYKTTNASSSLTPPVEGDPSCRCISPPSDNEFFNSTLLFEAHEGQHVNYSTYGFGCAKHDEVTTGLCRNCETQQCPDYCDRFWCWVDPTDCKLHHEHATFLYPVSNRHYSYATCRYVDALTSTELVRSLNGRTLRVGFTSNTAGWRGAYSEAGHFQGTLDDWFGPSVEFVKRAMKNANATIELVEPPSFLRDKSKEFFGGPSSFSFCVYAASLGFVDFCVGHYSVTPQRGSATDFYLLEYKDVYVIGMDDVYYSHDRYAAYTTILRPFTVSAWIFIVCFAIPILGALFIVHEYGRTQSEYPVTERVLVEEGTALVVKDRKVPYVRHLVWSLYTGLLSVLEQQYVASVETVGGKLQLIGFAFFVLVLIATYTANFAAILTQEVSHPLTGLRDVLQRNYRICALRGQMETTGFVHNVPSALFVEDPVDGKPGFACDNCKARTRTLDFLDPQKASDGDRRYCHVAIGFEEDIEFEQARGRHCNKTVVGVPLRRVPGGFPLFQGLSRALTATFIEEWNRGSYAQEVATVEDSFISHCQTQIRDETLSFRIEDLAGIWVVASIFAIVGLCTTFGIFLRKRARSQREKKHMRIDRFDQYGERVNKLKRGYSWVYQNKNIVFEQEARGLNSTIRAVSQRRPGRSSYKRSPSILSRSYKPTLADAAPDFARCSAGEISNFLLYHRFGGDTKATAAFLLQCTNLLQDNSAVRSSMVEASLKASTKPSIAAKHGLYPNTSLRVGIPETILEGSDSDSSEEMDTNGSSEGSEIVDTAKPSSLVDIDNILASDDSGLESCGPSSDDPGSISSPESGRFIVTAISPPGVFHCTMGEDLLRFENDLHGGFTVHGDSVACCFVRTENGLRRQSQSTIIFQLKDPIIVGCDAHQEVSFYLPQGEEDSVIELLCSTLQLPTSKCISIKDADCSGDDECIPSFTSIVGSPCVKCRLAGSDGRLYPREEGLLFCDPPLFVPRSSFRSVACGVGRSGYVELLIQTKDEEFIDFNHINAEELENLTDYIQGVVLPFTEPEVRVEGEKGDVDELDDTLVSFESKAGEREEFVVEDLSPGNVRDEDLV